jgi:predicted alpha/beta superfamily hydrolase
MSMTRRRLLCAAAGFGAFDTRAAAPSDMLPAMPPRLADAPALALPRTHWHDVELAGRKRRLFVAVPEGPAPAGGHPVLWALDGNTSFPLLAALLQQRAARPDDVRAALPMVVGLGYAVEAEGPQARALDYTLPVGGGQADRFLDLLSQLRPWLARQWPVHPGRHTLFGHSFGGLLTLYALFTRPGLFERHVAASPSIWWGERAILAERDAFVRHRAEAGAAPAQRLLVTAGSLEEGVHHPNPERMQRQQARRQVSAARELVQSLAGMPALQADYQLLDGEDHGSLVPRSAALALEVASA